MRKFFVAASPRSVLAGCASQRTASRKRRSTTRAPAPPQCRRRRDDRRPGAGRRSAARRVRRGRRRRSGRNPLRDPTNILSKRSVYFDYDSFVVKDEYRPLVEAHAKYLQANRTRA